MSKDITILDEHSGVRIVASDKYIRVHSIKATATNNPVGVVSLLPGIQIKLGRSMEEFVKMLKISARPLGVQKIAESKYGQETWRLLFFAVDSTDEYVVCIITTMHGAIVAVTFNQDLIYDNAFRENQRLSALHLATAGKCDSAYGQLSKAVQIIAGITGEALSNFEMKADDQRIAVNTCKNDLENQYSYLFVKDKNNYFNLLSISVIM